MITGSLLLILLAVILLGLGLARGSDPLLVGSIASSLLAAIALIVGARRPVPPVSAPAGTGAQRAGTGPGGSPVAAAPAGAPGSGAREPGPGAVPPEGSTATTVIVADDGPGSVPGARRDGQPPDAADQAGPSVYPVGGDPPADRTLDGTPGIPVGGSTPASGADGEAGRPDGDGEPAGTPDGGRVPAVAILEAPGTGVQPEEAEIVEDPSDEPAPLAVSPGDRAQIAAMTTEVAVVDGRPRYHLAECMHLLGKQSETLPVGEAIGLGFTPCGLCAPDHRLLAQRRGA